MISGCKNSLDYAYSLIGDGAGGGAQKIAQRLATCGIRDACPYARECAAKVAELRRDINTTEDGQLLVVTLATYDADALI
ncbi:MAG: hypothetical protein RIM33_09830 [Alphaproteobacteria bacterium]